MAGRPPETPPDAARQALRLEYATIGSTTIEAVAAITSGIIAASVALTSFGIDSGIEFISAIVVAVRLRSLIASGEANEEKERRALKVVAVLFYVLAVYVLIDATLTLALRDHPAVSPVGMAVSSAALIIMPLLAIGKRRVARRLDAVQLPGPAVLLRADSSETALCAVLSATTLLGLGLNAGFSWWWADPVASLAVVYFAIREGREAWHGEIVCIEDD
ncbi:MAG: cation transporter [Acidimicrobiales bacterium]